jgi:hypothetical protein
VSGNTQPGATVPTKRCRAGLGPQPTREGTARMTSQAPPADATPGNDGPPAEEKRSRRRLRRATRVVCQEATSNAAAGLVAAVTGYPAELLWHWISQLSWPFL